MEETEGQLFARWPGSKTDEAHFKVVKTLAKPDLSWEEKMITEVIGTFGKILVNEWLSNHSNILYGIVIFICLWQTHSTKPELLSWQLTLNLMSSRAWCYLLERREGSS